LWTVDALAGLWPWTRSQPKRPHKKVYFVVQRALFARAFSCLKAAIFSGKMNTRKGPVFGAKMHCF